MGNPVSIDTDIRRFREENDHPEEQLVAAGDLLTHATGLTDPVQSG